MKYIVIHSFKDLQDDNYIYQVGDFYPRKDIKDISEERIEELSGVNNKIGKSLIKAIEIESENKEEKAPESTGEKDPEPEGEGGKTPEAEGEGEKDPEPEDKGEKTQELSEKPKTNKKDKNK